MTKERTVLITGITGQDGSYMADLLLSKGYDVHGIVRRLSKPNYDNIEHILNSITLHEGDLHDQSSLTTIMRKVKPDEVYNLASQSFVGASWNQPVLTGDVTGLGALRIFEAVRAEMPNAKVYQAGSSEMFGKVDTAIQDEQTNFHPRSPYGVAKVYAHYIAVNFRESYDMFISNGILFNHESPRRGAEFVTKKIAMGVARIAKSNHKVPIQLGNIFAQRDWGYAPEYVEAMWLMLQQKIPDDYVVATCTSHSIKDFLNAAFISAGLGFTEKTHWEAYVADNMPANMRPVDIQYLRGDYSKAKRVLGWEPKIKFEELVDIMVKHELRVYK